MEMTAMQIDRAVVEQALEALEHHGGNLPWNAFVEVRKDLRAALAQQAEPLNLRDPAVQKRLATQWGYVPAAQAEPVEPVAWYQKRGREVLTSHPICWGREDEPWTPLYAAPPQRKLVPLTEAEIEHIGITHQSLRQVARAVERAVWEKNNG
jgi:hypothetical protein